MTAHIDNSMIEGIGDEVVYGIMGILVSMIPIYTLFVRRGGSRGQTAIHPESRANVEDARESLHHPHRVSTRSREEEQTCPVCLCDANFGVETNCGHIFCGQCIIAYWRHGNWLGAVRCPVCRQTVTILLAIFTDTEHRVTSEEKTEVINQLNEYNRRFSGEPRPWMDYVRDMPTLLRHCLNEFLSVGGLIMMFRLRIVMCLLAAVIYIVSPLDLLPEAMFGLLGLLDDAFVLLLVAVYVSILYRQFITNRAQIAGDT